MFVSIAQIECVLTSRLSEEFKWGFFVNWRGGAGRNVEDDLAQEISNRCSKSIVQRMGANKTLNSISKVCKATTGISHITEQFDHSAGIHKKSVQHTTRDSLEDEKGMVDDLMRLDPFTHVPSRSHDSFPDVKACPLRYLNIVEFHQWLENHKEELSTWQLKGFVQNYWVTFWVSMFFLPMFSRKLSTEQWKKYRAKVYTRKQAFARN